MAARYADPTDLRRPYAFDQHLNIVPALARYWDISPDGKTYTFELHPEARFHNGEPVTAEDCVFSFERLLTPGLNETNYHYFTRIVGAQDFREGKAKTVAGLRAIDERTFQIRFTTPFVPALSVLSMYSSKILPKKEVLKRGERFFKEPIGAGPSPARYVIAEARSRDRRQRNLIPR